MSWCCVSVFKKEEKSYFLFFVFLGFFCCFLSDSAPPYWSQRPFILFNVAKDLKELLSLWITSVYIFCITNKNGELKYLLIILNSRWIKIITYIFLKNNNFRNEILWEGWHSCSWTLTHITVEGSERSRRGQHRHEGLSVDPCVLWEPRDEGGVRDSLPAEAGHL